MGMRGSSSSSSRSASTLDVYARMGEARARRGMILSGLVAGELSCCAAWEKYLGMWRLASGMGWSRSGGIC